MKTKIYPIINMCGLAQGTARVTFNSLGKTSIEPITNAKFGGGLMFVNNYVHHGLIKAQMRGSE